MNIKELQKLVKFCQKNGIKRLKNEEIEIEIEPGFKREAKPKRSDQPIIQVTHEDAERMPSEDEMLMWATDSFDVIRDQRKAN